MLVALATVSVAISSPDNVCFLSWQSQPDPRNLIHRFSKPLKKSPFDPPHNAKERCVRRQNSKSTRDTNKSSFKTQKPSLSFKKPAFFCIHHSKEFRETIYFSRNVTITSHTYNESTDQQHLRVQFKANLREVQFKFLGDKKDFFLSWISIFVSSLSFELSKLFLYFWRFVFKSITHDSIN